MREQTPNTGIQLYMYLYSDPPSMPRPEPRHCTTCTVGIPTPVCSDSLSYVSMMRFAVGAVIMHIPTVQIFYTAVLRTISLLTHVSVSCVVSLSCVHLRYSRVNSRAATGVVMCVMTDEFITF